MSYDKKYVQNHVKCSGHWTGTPPGATNPGAGKCWACKYGCAVLCVLAITDAEPNETNVKANVNGSGDCKWFGFKSVSKPSNFPAIAGTGSHYVILVSETGNNYNVWDPSGGKSLTVPTSTKYASFRELK